MRRDSPLCYQLCVQFLVLRVRAISSNFAGHTPPIVEIRLVLCGIFALVVAGVAYLIDYLPQRWHVRVFGERNK